MRAPWMVTSRTSPCSTCSTNSEKGTDCALPRGVEVWNRLNSATSRTPMMTHRSRFLLKFKALPFHWLLPR